MSSLGDWIVAYINKLRHDLRPDTSDRRLQDAARLAHHNGWAPDQVAQRVNAGDYTRARSPVVIALIELERVAEDKPPRDPDTIPTPGCGSCQYGWIDPDVEASASPPHRADLRAIWEEIPEERKKQPPHPWPRGKPNPNPPSYTSTSPCPTCRPQLAARLAAIPTPGQRTPDQIAYLRHKRTMR